MKLKLFSDEEIETPLRDELAEFFELDKDKMQVLIDGLLERAKLKAYPASLDKQLASKIGVDSPTLINLMYTGITVISRILSGKLLPEIEKDLVGNGFAQENVSLLFSKLRIYSAEDKDILRCWTLAQQLDAVHLISFDWETNVRSIVDNGVVVGLGPVSVVRMSAHRTGQKIQRIIAELTMSELNQILKDLQTAKSEQEATIKELKSRLGELKVVVG